MERPGSFWRSMKGRALFLLIAAAAGGAAAWPFRDGFAGGLVLAACEAALVGGLADWFAVVALFRHPLGLSWLPHTAVVPSHRQGIINGIVDIVENDWLNVTAITGKIQSLSLTDRLLDMVGNERAWLRLRIIVGGLVGDLARSLDTDRTAVFLEKAVRERLIEPLAASVMRTMDLSSYEDEITDFIVDEFLALLSTLDIRSVLADYLRRAALEYKRSGFWRRLGLDTGEYLKIVDYDEAARAASRQLAAMVGEMRRPENGYRARLKAAFFGTEKNGTLVRLIDSWKNDALDRLDFTSSLAAFIDEVKESVSGGKVSTARSSNSILNHIMDLLRNQVVRLREDVAAKEKLDGWLKNEVARLVEKNHAVIGDMVRDNLERLNAPSFVASLEDRVGDDLQWIRINGTVVGALVGIGLYLVTRLGGLRIF